MPLPKSLDAYKDCEEHFARALASKRGIAVTVSAAGQVVTLMQKLNHYRERLRRESKRVYPVDDPRHGGSPYDKLQVKRDPDNPNRLLIKPYEIAVSKVEEL